MKAPDGLEYLTAPWAGGTWGGECGASIWIDGPLLVQTWFHSVYNHYVAETKLEYPNPLTESQGGCRVSCTEKFRHEGKHVAGLYKWED